MSNAISQQQIDRFFDAMKSEINQSQTPQMEPVKVSFFYHMKNYNRFSALMTQCVMGLLKDNVERYIESVDVGYLKSTVPYAKSLTHNAFAMTRLVNDSLASSITIGSDLIETVAQDFQNNVSHDDIFKKFLASLAGAFERFSMIFMHEMGHVVQNQKMKQHHLTSSQISQNPQVSDLIEAKNFFGNLHQKKLQSPPHRLRVDSQRNVCGLFFNDFLWPLG